MQRRFGRALLVLLTGMAAGLLTACGDAPVPTQDTARVFEGLVADYDQDAAALRASARVFDGTFGSETVLGRGDLNGDGRFTFTFEPTVDERALVDVQEDGVFCSGPTVSAAALGGSVRTLDVRFGGTRIGRIGQASSASALAGALAGAQEEGRTVVRMYVDGAVDVVGDCDDAFASYDLRLDAGWNVVDIRVDGSMLRVRTLEAAPEDVRWWYRPRSEVLTLDRAHDDVRHAVLPWLR